MSNDDEKESATLDALRPVELTVSRGNATGIPSASNYNPCAGSLGPKVLAAGGSGSSAVVPLTGSGGTSLALDVPIYSTGSVPPTVAEHDRPDDTRQGRPDHSGDGYVASRSRR